ncbi:ubiquitin carboxyl-terminal hydrolase 17-like protein 6 [Molossus nigricans]
MGAASLHLEDEPQFRVSPRLTSAWSCAAGAEVHRGPWGPEDPPPPSQPAHSPQDGLAAPENPVSWKRPWGVGAGLSNLGTTCYVNAALQCLTYTPPLASAMLSGQHGATCRKQTACVLCAMEAHVIRARLHPGDVIQPSQRLLTGFHRHKQEDAHEFLLFLLDAMQQACLRGRTPLDRPSEDTTLIRQTFGGYWRSRIECLTCHGVSDTLDPFLDIPLDIRRAQSVTQALGVLGQPEQLDGADAYECSVCMEKVPAAKTLTLHAAPQVLLLVLKRFSDPTGSKVHKDVLYPERLDLRPHLGLRSAGPLLYELCAVLVHAGRACDSGHYFCYVRAGDSRWFRMDDAQVTACDVSSALSQRAYVLFYVRKSEEEGDAGSAFVSGEPGGRGSERRVKGSRQRGPESHSNLAGPVLEEPVQEMSVKQITLAEWRLLQEQARPKPQFSLRKVHGALPTNAVVIHQSRHHAGSTHSHPGQESHLLNHPARDFLPQGAHVLGPVPGPRAGSRVHKRRKKGQRALVVSGCVPMTPAVLGGR